MSRPSLIVIATLVRIVLLAIACGVTVFDKVRSLKNLIPTRLTPHTQKAGGRSADAEQVGVMRMSDGPH